MCTLWQTLCLHHFLRQLCFHQEQDGGRAGLSSGSSRMQVVWQSVIRSEILEYNEWERESNDKPSAFRSYRHPTTEEPALQADRVPDPRHNDMRPRFFATFLTVRNMEKSLRSQMFSVWRDLNEYVMERFFGSTSREGIMMSWGDGQQKACSSRRAPFDWKGKITYSKGVSLLAWKCHIQRLMT